MLKNLPGILKGKNVTIYSKPYGADEMKEFKGNVIAIYIYADCSFIELDTDELVNIRYIVSIKVNS